MLFYILQLSVCVCVSVCVSFCSYTDRNQIVHTCAVSSGNAHRLKAISQSRPNGSFGGGGFRVSTVLSPRKVAKRLDREEHNLAPVTYYMDSSGHGHSIKHLISPLRSFLRF